MKEAATTFRFGDLLVALELVSETDLNDALQVAPQFGLPLGRTLVLSGRLTEEELKLVVELQSLVNRSSYPMESAKQAARMVRSKGVSATEALKTTGVKNTSDKSTLGSILLEAGAITSAQLDEAKKVSYETGMRLGRVLILNGVIDHTLLTKALDAQSMIRDKRLSVEQAVERLRPNISFSTAPSALSLEAHALQPNPAKKNVRFGEFLVLCGLATEAEILNAMETSLNNQQSLGEAIVELGLISKRIFDKAMQLHEQVCSGTIALKQATDEIHKMIFGDIAGDHKTPSPVLGELLKLTGLVTDADILEAIQLSNKYPSLIGKMLVVSGAIDEATLIASLRCQYLLKHGYLSIDGAISALQYAKKNKVSFDDALEELGIRKPVAE